MADDIPGMIGSSSPELPPPPGFASGDARKATSSAASVQPSDVQPSDVQPSGIGPGATYGMPSGPKPSSSLGLVAFIVAVIGFLIGILPFVALVFILPGLVLGIMALLKKNVSKGLAVAAVILSSIALVTNIVVDAAVVYAASHPVETPEAVGAAPTPSEPSDSGLKPMVTDPAPSATEPAPIAGVDPTAPAISADETPSQQNARESAESYLKYTPFSRSGLIDQLKFEGYSAADAKYAVDAVGVDWSQQAVLKAQSYLKYSAFSRSGLIDQLKFEGFPGNDAKAAVDSLHVDWNEQAALKAQSYLNSSSFSRSRLISQLKFEGFTAAQAKYGVDQVGL